MYNSYQASRKKVKAVSSLNCRIQLGLCKQPLPTVLLPNLLRIASCNHFAQFCRLLSSEKFNFSVFQIVSSLKVYRISQHDKGIQLIKKIQYTFFTQIACIHFLGE